MLFLGMNAVACVSIWLFVRMLFDQLGETAFPTIVAEVFWICVWILIAETGFLVVMSFVFKLSLKNCYDSLVKEPEK